MARLVTFQLNFDAKASGLDFQLAILAVFSLVEEGVRLRKPSAVPDVELAEDIDFRRERAQDGLRYFSGDFDTETGVDGDFWVGRFAVLRQGAAALMEFDAKHGVRFDRGPNLLLEKSSTYFLVDMANSRLVYMERADLPYTRMQSYVERAREVIREKNYENDFSLELEAYPFFGGIVEIFKLFKVVSHVAVTFRHSQSPGLRSEDAMIEALGAEEMKESATAPIGRSLSVPVLLQGAESAPAISRAIEHVRLNKANGVVEVTGVLKDDEKAKLSSANTARRDFIDAGTSRRDFLMATLGFLKRPSAPGKTVDESPAGSEDEPPAKPGDDDPA